MTMAASSCRPFFLRTSASNFSPSHHQNRYQDRTSTTVNTRPSLVLGVFLSIIATANAMPTSSPEVSVAHVAPVSPTLGYYDAIFHNCAAVIMAVFIFAFLGSLIHISLKSYGETMKDELRAALMQGGGLSMLLLQSPKSLGSECFVGIESDAVRVLRRHGVRCRGPAPEYAPLRLGKANG
jgi:hypothetical protein